MSIHIVREPEIGLSERIGDLENYYKEQILSKELKEIYNEIQNHCQEFMQKIFFGNVERLDSQFVRNIKVILNYRLEKLYSLALQGNKIETALKVIDQVGKLNNLYIDKQEVKLEDNQFEIVIQ